MLVEHPFKGEEEDRHLRVMKDLDPYTNIRSSAMKPDRLFGQTSLSLIKYKEILFTQPLDEQMAAQIVNQPMTTLHIEENDEILIDCVKSGCYKGKV